MSKIGKKVITLPSNVTLTFEKNDMSSDELIVIIKGPYGILKELILLSYVSLTQLNNIIMITRKNDNKLSKSYHGLKRAIMQNMILGVSKKFKKILLLEGIGYKFFIENNVLVLKVGFTHLIRIIIPSSITAILESTIKLSIEGISKEQVGSFAAKVRDVKPPEPYKGKGLSYSNETKKRKVGKKSK
jgi:large subunit ribosomal protein L6